MLVVLLVVLALALLVAIVYGLRRYQLKESETSADRQSPLPPLDINSVQPLHNDGNEEYQGGLTGDATIGERVPAEDTAPAVAVSEPESPVPVMPEPDEPVPAADGVPMPGVSWLQECAELKARGELDAALLVCESALPQWGAFSQSATILRALIRQAQKEGADVEPALTQLFRVAACASLLHDKTPDLPALSQRQLRQLPDSAWMSLEMPYQQIGYAELRLLGKSDQKLMREYWGEPEQHQSARHYHQDSWIQLQQVYS